LQGFFSGLDNGASNVEAFLVFLQLSLWEECGLLRIRASENDGQLCVVDPASFPVDFWLYHSKPGVA
jgi:hypothetical protein